MENLTTEIRYYYFVIVRFVDFDSKILISLEYILVMLLKDVYKTK